MRESEIEAALDAAVRAAGGQTRKIKWIGRRHAPDRLVLLNGAHFVEVKRPGEKPREGQARELETLRRHGVRACWIDTTEKVDAFIESITRAQ